MLFFYRLYFIVFSSNVSKKSLFTCYRCTSVDRWAVAFEARVFCAPNPYCTLGCHYSRVIITVQLQITRVKQHAHNTHRLVRGQRHDCRVCNTILPNTLNLTYTLKFNVIDGI